MAELRSASAIAPESRPSSRAATASPATAPQMAEAFWPRCRRCEVRGAGVDVAAGPTQSHAEFRTNRARRQQVSARRVAPFADRRCHRPDDAGRMEVWQRHVIVFVRVQARRCRTPPGWLAGGRRGRRRWLARPPSVLSRAASAHEVSSSTAAAQHPMTSSKWRRARVAAEAGSASSSASWTKAARFRIRATAPARIAGVLLRVRGVGSTCQRQRRHRCRCRYDWDSGTGRPAITMVRFPSISSRRRRASTAHGHLLGSEAQ